MDENVFGVFLEEDLRNKEKIRHQSSLEDDGDVGGVEELD